MRSARQYVRVDTKFASHPKVLDIGPLGEAMWLRGLCYAGEQMTDGFVPTGFIRRMGDIPDALAVASSLVAAGLWSEVEGGFQVHDYLDWQRSRSEIEQISTARAAAGQRGGSKPKAAPSTPGKQTPTKPDTPTNQPESKTEAKRKQNGSKSEAETETETNTETDGDTPPEGPPHGADAPPTASADHPAVLVDPDPPDETPQKRRKRLPSDFIPSAELRSWAKREFGFDDATIDYETEKFSDHFHSSGATKLDWPLTWKNWMRGAAEGRFSRGRASPGPSRPAPPGVQHAGPRVLSDADLEAIARGEVTV